MTSQPTQEEISLSFVPASQRNNELQLLCDDFDSVLCDAADKLDATSNSENNDGEGTEYEHLSPPSNYDLPKATMKEADSLDIDFIDFSKWNDNDFEKSNEK